MPTSDTQEDKANKNEYKLKWIDSFLLFYFFFTKSPVINKIWMCIIRHGIPYKLIWSMMLCVH